MQDLPADFQVPAEKVIFQTNQNRLKQIQEFQSPIPPRTTVHKIFIEGFAFAAFACSIFFIA